ncbi:MAG: rhamnulokinase [Beutenbergiaceae bacterium]
MTAFAAVDLGASSGRVIRGELIETDGQVSVRLDEVARFDNGAQADAAGTLRWEISGLFQQVLAGLRAAAEAGPVAAIGIDTWAVDYGLLDAEGELLAEPAAYRDGRNEAAVPLVHTRVSAAELYAIGGLQHLPFNTVFQLVAEQAGPLWARARRVLLIPDLLAYWLTGQQVAELTNASTTGLVDVGTGQWSGELLERVQIPPDLLAQIVTPGSIIGAVSADLAEQTGLGRVPVVAVGSHDTASAIVGVPAQRSDFAYISCGTWSLVGVELDQPIRSEASRAKNFTNELGVDGTVRYLRNVMGLWVLQETIRCWQQAGRDIDLEQVLAAAATAQPWRTVIDIDHPDFLPPGDMPARIAAHARASGQPTPSNDAELVRAILDSLALAYRRAIADAVELSGMPAAVVHVVGGGSQNALLMQLTADATGREVIAGPAESTAIGNVLVQARALGALPADHAGIPAGLAALRAVGAAGVELTSYQPAPGEHTRVGWQRAQARVDAVPIR